MGSLPLWKGATLRTIRIQNNQWSLEHCPVLCIVQFAALFAQKCDLLPPPPQPRHFCNGAFSQISKSIHIPPQRDEILAHWTKSLRNPGKSAKTHGVGAL